MSLPRHLCHRLWRTRLSAAIHRSFVQFEYDPGRPWFLTQSAADDAEEDCQAEDCDAWAKACIGPIDKNETILPSEEARQAELARQSAFWQSFWAVVGAVQLA